MQADVEGLSRALRDEGGHGRQVNGFGGAELTAPRIKAFQLFITTRQEVVQAESLVIQCCNRGGAKRTHPAVSTRKHRIHPTQAHGFNSTNGFILLRSTLVRCVTPRKRFHHRIGTRVPPNTRCWDLLPAASSERNATSAARASARPWFERAGGGRDKAPAGHAPSERFDCSISRDHFQPRA